MKPPIDQPYFVRTTYGWSRRKAVIFVCGWRTSVRWYWPVFRLLNISGYKVYAYEVNTHMASSSNILDYVYQVQAIKDDALALIAAAPPTTHWFTMGNSLGSEIALYIMKSSPQVRATVLNTVRGDTAQFIWTAPSAVLFKAGYVAHGDYKGSLTRKLRPISARYNLDALGDRPVLLYYSRADKVIPRHNTELLIRSMRNAGTNVRIKRNWVLGHFMASAKNFAYFWRWLRFLHRARS